jgi:hypothetical protein
MRGSYRPGCELLKERHLAGTHSCRWVVGSCLWSIFMVKGATNRSNLTYLTMGRNEYFYAIAARLGVRTRGLGMCEHLGVMVQTSECIHCLLVFQKSALFLS